MAWIPESSGGEELKRRKIEDLESEKRYLIPRSCSSKNSEEEWRKLEESESETEESEEDFGRETIDILDMLFTDSTDFLVKFNGQKVMFDDLNGKTIVLFMSSMEDASYRNGLGMMDMVEAYNELRPQDSVEFVFVPIITIGESEEEEEYFNNLNSKMPWPAIPFSDKHKCHQIETRLWPRFPLNSFYSHSPYYIIFDPKGKILLSNADFFDPCPSIFHLYGGADLFSLADLSLQNLEEKDKETLNTLNLDQLLASPYRDFLLARDGTKVPISSLRDKVVGLYFCDNVPTPPPRMEALKKVYREAMDMGYGFEIVQINLHFRNNYKNFPHREEMPLQVCCQAIPWLTLPYKDTCCRRLRRLFKWHKGLRYWKGDSLVIIDPRELNIDGTRYERHAINTIEHIGIEAYPFTRKWLVELEYARLREVKLHTIFPLGGPPLIRRGCEQVPRSVLFGRPILVLFSPHFSNKSGGDFNSMLESLYRNGVKFEVVYVSCDNDVSTFDEFIKEMPWLVHPYSWDFAKWWPYQFRLHGLSTFLCFDARGELVMKLDSILQCLDEIYDVGYTDFVDCDMKEYEYDEDFPIIEI